MIANEQEVIEMLHASEKFTSEYWGPWEAQRIRIDRVRAMFNKASKRGLPVEPLMEILDEAILYIHNVQEGLSPKNKGGEKDD